MAGLNLYIQADTVPALDPLPSNAQALIDYCAKYLGIGGASGFNGINFGPNTPAPQNRSLPWFKTDSLGNPIGLFSWNGLAWTTIPTQVSTGPTSSRPATPSDGSEYYDTTIRCLLLFNAAQNAWTTAAGSIGDIKETTAATLAAALTANPGWLQHTASSGCVIGGADSNSNGPATAHAQGTLIGEEAHTIAVSELPSHTHPLPYGTNTGQFQNGPQASGVYPAVTPGSTGIAVQSTGSTGGGQGANVIQPTMYLYRLYKSF